jgi:hypothetical protein
MTDERRARTDAFGQVYVYYGCAFGVKPCRRRATREKDIRKIFIDLRGRENKRSFWELASYDDLSARFNGVSSVAVTMLAVDPRSLLYVLVFPRTPLFGVRVGLRARIYGPLSHSFPLSELATRAAEEKYQFL